jgi:hypothetical protein
MRLFPQVFFLSLVCVSVSFTQNSPQDPEIARAQEHLEKIRALVDAGAAPRAQLAEAEDQIADAEDAAVLRRTIYGDLTDAQSDEMIAAAGRRYERRKQAFDKTQQLVIAGVATRDSLSTLQGELDLARTECDLANQRAQIVRELSAMAQTELSLESPVTGEPFGLGGSFNPAIFARVETAFETHFGKPLPVSAMGETAVHRALGFNHTGRVDVALNPDQPEGVWLRQYLGQNHIPYLAFRQAVPGKATGAHIHIGPGSSRIAHGG